MKEPVITLTLEEYEELRKEHECLEKEHAELQRKYEASLQEYSRQVEEISACTAVIADLRWKLADLTRRLWGKSSEKRHLPEDAGQLSICFESPSDVNDPVAEEQKTAGKSVTSENGYNRFRKSFTKKITPHARKPIDPSLPREEIIIPMPEGLSLEGATKLGEEVNEQYAVSPARFYVKRIIRPKYRLADGRIITAPMPVMAHPHSNASESVLAHIATAKYYDHLPLHRQLDIFEREGIHLSPSTVSNWMMAAAQRLEPIYNELRELVKDSYYVMADETPHPVLESDRPGALHRGICGTSICPGSIPPSLNITRAVAAAEQTHCWQDRSGWYRVTALQYMTSSTRYPESCICAAGHTSGATLWKRKEMTLPEQGMHLDK